MVVFSMRKKVDMGVLSRPEASRRFRHHAQTYLFSYESFHVNDIFPDDPPFLPEDMRIAIETFVSNRNTRIR